MLLSHPIFIIPIRLQRLLHYLSVKCWALIFLILIPKSLLPLERIAVCEWKSLKIRCFNRFYSQIAILSSGIGMLVPASCTLLLVTWYLRNTSNSAASHSDHTTDPGKLCMKKMKIMQAKKANYAWRKCKLCKILIQIILTVFK